jgi:hypothetical protein
MLFFWFHGTVALPHTRRFGLRALAFAAGWRQCGVRCCLLFFLFFFLQNVIVNLFFNI